MSYKNYEKGYARKSTTDGPGEYSYINTECGAWWYSVVKYPMYRNKCRCPKCGKTVLVVVDKYN